MRKRLWLFGGAGVVALVAVIVIVVVAVSGGGDGSDHANGDEAQIRRVISNFATAVDQRDRGRIISLLCQEEAEDLSDGLGDDGADTGMAGESTSASAVKVSDVRISGDVATVLVTRPSVPAATMYLLKEGGAWKVCAPAANRGSSSMSGSAGVSGSPTASPSRSG